MNKVVIIGNGFDLAHGLKTRYSDFIRWYWTKKYKELKGCQYLTLTDSLCAITRKGSNFSWHDALLQNNHYYEDEKAFDFLHNKDEFSHLGYIHKETLLEAIDEAIETFNWVDIEYEYYKLLKSSADNSHFENPDKINIQFEYLCTLLNDYISEIDSSDIQIVSLSDEIKDILISPINSDEIAVEFVEGFGIKEDSVAHNPQRILCINFNYTTTLERYIEGINNIDLIHIHGSIQSRDSIIFGFGDDTFLKSISLYNDKEYLKYIKTYRYLETSNYRNILKFLATDVYQVVILGHSCGISDRTLLNTILEHDNCASIKPYYYSNNNKDNYIELVQNIGNAFSEMKTMRDRVVNKTMCQSFPQLKY